MTMSSDLFEIVADFGKRLASPLGFKLDGGEPGGGHPLAHEIAAALEGRAASFPHIGAKGVTWVTLGPSAQALREAITDLRCWILPSLGWEATPPVVVPGEGTSEFSNKLLAVSPGGYFRWECRRSDLEGVIAKLQVMRRLAERAPLRTSRLRPTLEMLRRQFTVGLATGDYALATEALDEIDRRQLDTAVNALSMRIRRDEAFGDNRAIVDNPNLDHLLTFTLPRRVAAAIVKAHHAVLVAELEAAADFEQAADTYQAEAYDRLAGLVSPDDAGSDATLARMVAYNAWADGDLATLKAIGPSDPLVAYLLSSLRGTEPEAEPAPVPVTPPPSSAVSAVPAPQANGGSPPAKSIADISWADLVEAVIAPDRSALDAFLQRLSGGHDDVARGVGDGAALLELFTDERVARDQEAGERADAVLTTVIDTFVCEPVFPQKSRLPLYDNILEIWSDSRSGSNDAGDGQLVLMMSDAILRLDAKSESAIAERLRRWWKARPVRARLAWLAEALELLTDHSASKAYLELWYDAAAIIKADASLVGPNDRRLWTRLGCRLGLDNTVAREALGITEAASAVEEADLLGSAGLKKIAIVSLHERAAKEAALEIGQRTGANVLVVSDYAAGDATQSAATADVILFVWGAAKHAVYRAFDKVRDRLEYVQGTGSGSIVRALERRVARGSLV